MMIGFFKGSGCKYRVKERRMISVLGNVGVPQRMSRSKAATLPRDTRQPQRLSRDWTLLTARSMSEEGKRLA
jgi:hypothetical protein